MSYLPGFTIWPRLDRSTSATLGIAFFVIHMFRMTLFFVVAGFFARGLLGRGGVAAFIRNRATRIVVFPGVMPGTARNMWVSTPHGS